jgi:N-acetylmuramic acid 6-phosphate etherase
VRLGKVYANRMVDVAVTNSKLEDRALRILQDLGGIARDQGRELLDQSGGSVKLALLMAQRGCDADQAKQLVQLHGGQLRLALEA